MAEPKVRFKRDDGSSYPDIQQVPFGDVVKPFTEKTKTENEDVLLSCAINGVFLNTELFGHQRGASNKGYKKIRRNTLILSAQNLHLGNANVNQRFDHGIISPAYNTYDIVGCNPDYMAQWVKRDATKKFFYDATTTGASQCRRNVDWNALYEQIFYVPCEEEQQKIADFLSSVDEVITASEEEVANLETQKKAVMKKIFSQEVRFKRADGSDFPEWEEKTIGDVTDSLTGYAFESELFTEKGIRLLRGMNIKRGDLDFSEDICKYWPTSEGLEKFLLQENDLIVQMDGALVGKSFGLVKAEHLPALLVQRVTRLRGDSTIIQLLYQILSTGEFDKDMKLNQTSTAVPHISLKDITGYGICIPSDPEEQRLIADFLSNFDEAIVAAKKELELWKELKKGLLQQMFV